MLVEKIERCYERIEKLNEEYNALLFVMEKEKVLERAKEVEKKMEEGKAGKLAGCVFTIKNNIAVKGYPLTCASKMLRNYISPYNATVVEKILQEDGIIIGLANMDEFACGSEGRYSFKPCRNAINPEYVAGGSSSGSAVSVALGMADVSLGSDTGGSIRCPSAFNGVIGFKPSYGRVSRFGLADMTMDFDQIGVIGKRVEEVEKVFNVIKGEDRKDPRTLNFREEKKEINKLAYLEPEKLEIDEKVKMSYTSFLDSASSNFSLSPIFPEFLKYAVELYYVVVMGEFASAMQKFDGLRYGYVGGISEYFEDIKRIRGKNLGEEVKRRILLGTFVTSKEQSEGWFKKAKRAREWFRKEMKKLFEEYDAIILPTMPKPPWKIGEKLSPLEVYYADIFTTPANLAEIPAITVPWKKMDEFPGFIQIWSKKGNDLSLLKFAEVIEKWK